MQLNEYTLHEEVAPDGYTIAADTAFKLDENGKVTAGTTKVDNGILLVEDSKTNVKISKVDVADGKELAGAKIQIRRAATAADAADDNTKYADEGKTIVIVDEWVSEEGKVHEIEGLVAGTEYTLHEEVAPDGYTIAMRLTKRKCP